MRGKHRDYAAAEAMRQGVQTYLRDHYGYGDKSWHPLFMACRELYAYLMEEVPR